MHIAVVCDTGETKLFVNGRDESFGGTTFDDIPSLSISTNAEVLIDELKFSK